MKNTNINDQAINAPSSLLPEFAYLLGKPTSEGKLRSFMDDFKVFEDLPYEPSGEGEHLYIRIRKTGANTIFVARSLAQYFNVKESHVTYAGLKDRFAVTEQWFGVHVPGKELYDLSDLNIDGVEILHYQRHSKKLRIGALTGNRFELTLRDVSDIDDVQRRWHAIQACGVPNYFGEQRFGIAGGNIDKAQSLFLGAKVKDKKKRGIYLSAARSLLFNTVIDARITNQLFDTPIIGDVMMLAGTQSVFKTDAIDDEMTQRLTKFDIDITAPMWGAGNLMTQLDALHLEETTVAKYEDFVKGLPKFGLKQERRRIRITLKQTKIEKVDDKTLVLSFFLPAGCYATSVLRELIHYTDMTERVEYKPNGSV